MKSPTLRQARVGDLLRETLADLLLRKVKDPRVSEVTITGVEVSADLKHAHVYFCVRDDEVKEAALQGLKSAEGFFRHELKHIIKIKTIPNLTFSYDTSFDYGSHIDEILDKIKAHDDGSH
jgi:ribosome-binding factor A